ncbi:hypothetical protein ACVW0J_002841 [Bradyrhizobium sp. i1.7.7]
MTASTLNSRLNFRLFIAHLRLHETPNLGVHQTGSSSNSALGVAFPERPSQESPLAGSSLSWSPRVPSDFGPSEWLPLAPAWSPRAPSPSEFSLGDLPALPPDFGPSEWLLLSSDYEASMRPFPEAAPARSSDIYRNLESFVDLPSTPQEVRDDARSAPVPRPVVRSPFFIGRSGAPQELEDIGHLVGNDWQHGSQPVTGFLVDVLDNNMLLPNSRIVPRPVSINGETYSITVGARGCRDVQFIHYPPAPDAQIGALATGASSSHDRSGRVLDTQPVAGRRAYPAGLRAPGAGVAGE